MPSIYPRAQFGGPLSPFVESHSLQGLGAPSLRTAPYTGAATLAISQRVVLGKSSIPSRVFEKMWNLHVCRNISFVCGSVIVAVPVPVDVRILCSTRFGLRSLPQFYFRAEVK